MSILLLLIFILIGLFAGFTAGLLGIGGGLVTVPALLCVFKNMGFSEGYDIHVAVGTSLATMIFTATSSGYSHFKHGKVLIKESQVLLPVMAIGAIVGAAIANYLPGRELEVIFAIAVILFGIYFLTNNEHENHQDYHRMTPAVLICFGFFIGLISAMMGIGGGLLTVPLLVYYRYPLKNAIATSALTGIPIAVLGAISYLLLGYEISHDQQRVVGYVYWPAFVVIGIVSTIAAPYSAKLVYCLPVKILRRCFGVFLILTGCSILLFPH